jgi:tellurite methyltransferase
MAPIIPSTFVADWIARVGRDRPRAAAALDIACGRGRHTALLAASGFRAFGVDVRLDALADAAATIARSRRSLLLWCADLEHYPLPRERFHLVVVSRYLQRDLFPSIRAAVARGGYVVYETFTRNQLALGVGPTSSDHLLEPGELQGYFGDWETAFYEEVTAPEAVARLVGRRPAVSDPYRIRV